MSKIKNKFVAPVLLIIFLLNVILRYPTTLYSKGSDSFENLSVSLHISDEDNHPSFIHVLSYFGLYPESRNMGAAFLLTGFSETIGVNIEFSMLLLNFSLILLSMLGTFLFSKQVFPDNSLSLMTTFLLTTSRKMYYFTDWTYSYRGPFICLLPVVLFWVFYSRKRQAFPYIRYSVLLAILLLSLISIHRLGYFFMFFIPLVLLIKGFYFFYGRKLRVLFVESKNRNTIGGILLIIMLLLLVFLNTTSFYTIKYGDVAPAYVTDIVNNIPILAYPLSFIFGYSKITGIFFPFTFFGLLYLYLAPLRSMNVTVMVIVSFLFLFFWYDLSYASMFFLPFLLLLNSKGITIVKDKLCDVFNKDLTNTILVLSLLFSQMLLPTMISIPSSLDSNISTSVHESAKNEFNTYSYDAGTYLRYNSKHVVLQSETVSTSKVIFYCGCPTKQLLSSDFTEGNVRRGELADLIDATTRSIYELSYEPSRDYKYSVLLSNKTWLDPGVDQVMEYEFAGNNTYNYLSTPGLEEYALLDDGELKKLEMTVAISSQRYKIYDNGQISSIYFSY